MKSRTRFAAMGYGVGMAAWVGYSYKMRNKPIPSIEEAHEYAKRFMQDVGLGDLYGTWREEFLPAYGRDLALYHFESKPGDPVMVFVPGTSVYALLYIEYMYKLSRQGFNVVGFDPRGHGMSGGKRGSYTLGGLAEDARAVIDHAIKVYGDKAAISGSSQGGMTAFYCAAADSRLKAAICHNVIAPDEPDNYRMTRWPSFYRRPLAMLPFLRPVVDSPLGELMVPISAYLDLKAEPTRMLPDVGKFLKEDPLAVNSVSLAALASLGASPMARRVEDIETPVMAIHAGQDNIFPEDYVRRVYERLNCEKEFVYLPDAPHLVMIDYVDTILPPIVEWLKRMMED
jgi:pimeloyl-ACP methyl ester carboxylesterase